MAPRPPRIGINCDHFKDPQSRLVGLREPYLQAIQAAGGVALMLPFLESADQIEAALDAVDGFILTGGDDLRPERLGQPAHPASIPMLPERDRSDFLLIESLVARRMPTLAICLGFQELNLALGGTLWQDLPTEAPPRQVPHCGRKNSFDYIRHDLHVDPGSLLSQLWNEADRAVVNSHHHQGVHQLGRGLRAIAWAPDWLVEAVLLVGHPFMLGVQWHPEKMIDDPRQLALFKALIGESIVHTAP